MSIADINHQRVINEQRERIAKLQAFVDAAGAKWILTIPTMFMSMESANTAKTTYSKEWFDAQPYSLALKKEMAAAFIDAAAQYTTLSIIDWESILAQ